MLYDKGFDQLNPYPAPSTFFGICHSQFHKELVLPPLRGHNLFLYSKVGFPINSAGEENLGQRQRRSRSRVQINYPGGEDFGEEQSRTGSAPGTELTKPPPHPDPPHPRIGFRLHPLQFLQRLFRALPLHLPIIHKLRQILYIFLFGKSQLIVYRGEFPESPPEQKNDSS